MSASIPASPHALAPSAARTWPFWVIVASVTAVDFVTKAWAVDALSPRHIPHRIVGDVVRFTLAYNPGAAFGMHLGPASRWIFAGLSIVIIGVLLRALVSASPGERRQELEALLTVTVPLFSRLAEPPAAGPGDQSAATVASAARSTKPRRSPAGPTAARSKSI